MVVDADPVALARTAEILGAAGFSVITRDVGIGTRGAILRARPAAVLLEFSMPLIGGAEIVSALRGSEMLRDTRVVLTGALPAGQLAARAEECGANTFIPKPFEPEVLLATVQRLLHTPRGDSGRPLEARSRTQGYVLVATDELTRRYLRGSLGARVPAVFTDSGTEALRLIYSTNAPRMVVVGTSLTDLPHDVVWRKAVERDESWRQRMVLVEERSCDAAARDVDPEMLRWESADDPQYLVEIFERLQAGL